MLALPGTTTLEVKCCDGLDAQSETKVLRVLADLVEQQPVDLVSTYSTGAVIPPEWESNVVNGYVEYLVTQVFPMLREKCLAVLSPFPVKVKDSAIPTGGFCSMLWNASAGRSRSWVALTPLCWLRTGVQSQPSTSKTLLRPRSPVWLSRARSRF